MREEMLDDIVQLSYYKAKSDIWSGTVNVVEQVVLDLLKNDIIVNTLDAF